MTPKEAFKIGFLEKCAADGLTPEDTMLRIQHAKFMLKSAGPAATGGAAAATGAAIVGGGAAAGKTGVQGMSKLLSWLIPLGLIAPPAAGAFGGYTLARMQDDTYDKDEAKQREEVGEYQRAIERLQQLQTRQATGV